MKIRSGFVSNSSSASFIIEVKADTYEDLACMFHSNMEMFERRNVLKILDSRIKREEDAINEKPELAESYDVKYRLQELKRRKSEIENFQEKEYGELVKLNKKDQEHYRFSERRYRVHLFDTFLYLHYWSACKVDNYFSINVGGPIIYNGWEDVTNRKEFIELIAFCAFFKKDFRIRVEEDCGGC